MTAGDVEEGSASVISSQTAEENVVAGSEATMKKGQGVEKQQDEEQEEAASVASEQAKPLQEEASSSEEGSVVMVKRDVKRDVKRTDEENDINIPKGESIVNTNDGDESTTESQDKDTDTNTDSNATRGEAASVEGTPGRRFFTRLNTWRSTGRKVLSTKASEVMVAATPVVVKAGQAVQAAAERAKKNANTNASVNEEDEDEQGEEGKEENQKAEGAKEDEVDASEQTDPIAPSETQTSTEENPVTASPIPNPSESTKKSTTESNSKPPPAPSPSPSTSDLPVAVATATNFRGRYSLAEQRQDSFSSRVSDNPSQSQSQSQHSYTHPRIGAAGETSLGSAILNAFHSRGGGANAAGGSVGVDGIKGGNASTRHAGTQSQTALILQNAATAPHVQKLLSELQEGEYVLLLGNGLMGVNLKDCYTGGVYVDWVAPNGNADKSGVVGIGDVLVRVGDVDVRKETIRAVPEIIARSSRPVVVVLTRAHLFPALPSEGRTPMDDAIAAAFDLQERVKEERERSIVSMPLSSPERHVRNPSSVSATSYGSSGASSSDDSSVEEASTSGVSHTDSEANRSRRNSSTRPTRKDSWKRTPQSKRVSTHSFARQNSNSDVLPAPDRHVKRSLAAYATRKQTEMSCFAALRRASSQDDDFRCAMRRAFVSCCADARCLPFLAAHVSREDGIDGDHLDGTGGGELSPTGGQPVAVRGQGQASASVKFMMWLEIQSYKDVWGVTPERRRRHHARRIAFKFLLPGVATACSSSYSEDDVDGAKPRVSPPTSPILSDPMFDLRSAVPLELLTELDAKLQQGLSSDPIGKDVFDPIQSHVEHSLAGAHFASFLMSDHCARMRAYLRGSAPFIAMPLDQLLHKAVQADDDVDGRDAENCLAFLLLHAAVEEKAEKRGGGIHAALYIRKVVLKRCRDYKAIKEKDDDTVEVQKVLNAFETLWKSFLSPECGVLDSKTLSDQCEAALQESRRVLLEAVTCVDTPRQNSAFQQDKSNCRLCQCLLESQVQTALERLASELVYQYAVNVYSKFKSSDVHEMLCKEFLQQKKSEMEEERESDDAASGRPPPLLDVNWCHVADGDAGAALEGNGAFRWKLPDGCTDRLFRQSQLPDSISAHRPRVVVTEQVGNAPATPALPGSTQTNTQDSDEQEAYYNAQYAIVFGADDGTHVSPSPSPSSPSNATNVIRRFASTSLSSVASSGDVEGSSSLPLPNAIPSALESYATVPLARDRPFGGATVVSEDGWEVSLVNFRVPHTSPENPQGCFYGVSLVLNRREVNLAEDEESLSSQEDEDKEDDDDEGWNPPRILKMQQRKPSGTNFSHVNRVREDMEDGAAENHGAKKTDEIVHRVNRIFEEAPTPVREREGKEGNKRWSRSVRENGNCIGIALVSSANVIPAMRGTLSAFCAQIIATASGQASDKDLLPVSGLGPCDKLADLLGTFSNRFSSQASQGAKHLQQLLLPHLRPNPWTSSTPALQEAAFVRDSVEQLLRSLQPTPLALVLITALLEQKIVFSSSRRSLLLSAATAVTKLLAPLEWPHLMVPLVPVTVAGELVHYPAPFMIGIPADEQVGLELLNKLPHDVTLVDLDAGRVILAPKYAADERRDLRLQVLYLAEELGGLLRSKIFPETWLCDSPLKVFGKVAAGEAQPSALGPPTVDIFETVKHICSAFVLELLEGTNTCCIWIEDRQRKNDKHSTISSDPIVLLDEDRFFQIKNLRALRKYTSLVPSRLKETSSPSDMNVSLTLDDFDLVLEIFLRGQAMSTFVSSQNKENMTYW